MHVPNEIKDSGVRTAIVLGSGLGPFAEGLDHEHVLDYASVAGLPSSGVPGHAGRFVLARLGGEPLLVAQGRVHLYEGYSAKEVVRHVEFMHAAGIETLLLTNAAGIVNPSFRPGSWMAISDHINLTGESPLHGGPNFIDMSSVYSARVRGIFAAKARELGFDLHEGVYAAMRGPQFETPAEVRMLGILGADAVGMSTVAEATRANSLGMEVAGFSCLTNWGAGLSGEALSHEDVTETGRAAAAMMVGLLTAGIQALRA